MTPASLRKVCLENDGYAHAPELNDVLHLHRKGIAEIENLEPYVGLKTIYLESNSVDTLEGLLHLSLLRCLYMAKNALTDVEGAVRLKALVTLDISGAAPKILKKKIVLKDDYIHQVIDVYHV